MKTELLKLGAGQDAEIYSRAGELLREGSLVVIPTETVYGLAASIEREEALRSIYEVKGRPSDNPLIVHIAEPGMAARVAREVPKAAETLFERFWPGPLTVVLPKLFERFWPGPLTVVLPKRPEVSRIVSGGLDTVALRCPSSAAAREIIRAAGVPLAAPSANRSGRPSPTRAEHLCEELAGRVPLIVDGGPCAVGVESTVVSLCGVRPRLLRPGAVTLSQLRELLGPVDVDEAVTGELAAGSTVSAPGMKYRHYAPACPMTLYQGARAASVMKSELDRLIKEGKKVGVICFDGEETLFPGAEVRSIGPREDHLVQAQRIFAVLRELDCGLDQILSVTPDPDGVGLAVYNRMLKAAGHDLRRTEGEA